MDKLRFWVGLVALAIKDGVVDARQGSCLVRTVLCVCAARPAHKQDREEALGTLQAQRVVGRCAVLDIGNATREPKCVCRNVLITGDARDARRIGDGSSTLRPQH